MSHPFIYFSYPRCIHSCCMPPPLSCLFACDAAPHLILLHCLHVAVMVPSTIWHIPVFSSIALLFFPYILMSLLVLLFCFLSWGMSLWPTFFPLFLFALCFLLCANCPRICPPQPPPPPPSCHSALLDGLLPLRAEQAFMDWTSRIWTKCSACLPPPLSGALRPPCP